jgi:uncharacterized protein (TIGR00159 family)
MTFVFEQLRHSFRIADAADIVLVSVFLYTIFLWFRSTASRQILVVVGILTIVYVLARTFKLYITVAMFQAVLAVAVIATIVVFQQELRRSFARLALLGNFGRPRTQTVDENLDVLVEIAFDLAKKRVGALLVIRGKEALYQHLRGSVAVDAQISKALLDSIFDPHSMGHDGAVIIDQDRIAQFAAHLPLSENSREISNRGTRHSAAVGLSELCDAMIVVVSEERGEVSIAEGGKLRKVDSAVELKKRLDRVSQLARPRDDTDGRRRLLVANFGLKLAAVLVACVAWFFIGFDAETVQKTFVVPIEYRNLSDKMDIDDSAPTEARLTLTGHERAFNLLAPSTLKVSLDLSDVAEGPQQIAIDESHVKLPSNLALFRSVPRVVSFGVHSWVKVRLAVEARTEGRLPRELRQREIQVVPGEVQVLIWRSFKSSTTHVSTEVINLGRMTDAVELKAKLVLPEHMRLEVGQPLQVSVMLEHSTDNADTANTPGGGGR